MLPSKRLNIYPKNKENIEAVIEFYFSELQNKKAQAVSDLVNSSLSMNQIEFLLLKLNQAIPIIFKPEIKDLSADNMVRYGLDALIKGGCTSCSQNRLRLTLAFRKFVESTSVDINFLRENN